MALAAVNIAAGNTISAAHVHQYYDLLTGGMTDQPVSLPNTVTIGGSQSIGSTTLRVQGVTGQTGNLLELRTLASDVNAVFSVSPVGALAFGPGGGTAVDTTITRSSINQLTLSGALQVNGNVGIGVAPASNTAVAVSPTVNASGAAATGLLINPTLVAQVNNDTLSGLTISPTYNDNAKTGVVHNSLRVTAGVIDFSGTATVNPNLNNYAAPSSGLTYTPASGSWSAMPNTSVTIPAGTYMVSMHGMCSLPATPGNPAIGLLPSGGTNPFGGYDQHAGSASAMWSGAITEVLFLGAGTYSLGVYSDAAGTGWYADSRNRIDLVRVA